MKYLVSFRTTLRVSRYLFRSLALLIWLLGALLTVFYLFSALHQKEVTIREQLQANFNQTQWYTTHLGETLRDLKYVTEHQVSELAATTDNASISAPHGQLLPQLQGERCPTSSPYWSNTLGTLGRYLSFWQSQFVASYGLSRILLFDEQSQCLATFRLGDVPEMSRTKQQTLRQHMRHFAAQDDEEKRNPLYWVAAGQQPDSGTYSITVPIYPGGQQNLVMMVEQSLKLNESITAASLPVQVALVDASSQLAMGSEPLGFLADLRHLPATKQWFGYVNGYRQLVMKNQLSPGPYSLVYSVSSHVIYGQMKLMLINGLLLNLFSALFLLTITLLCERRMFTPAVDHAQRLEEHELFNRKIVASAPVGICILRLQDGSNLLSNELAHNYLALLTAEDRLRLGEIIRGQQINFVDMLTESKTNLQMSFVHSRYRNENVAICVLVDVSARVKMEQSLQETVAAAEQANQAKSMFLATVSHELRTPLYGIIGNLDLLQSRELPESVRGLVSGMNNSSSLLLKIINDILDFSKIESQQLKIAVAPFSPQEVLSHIVTNFLPLVIRKQLTLWCYIEPNVPCRLASDAIRLQQVVSNLLSNAIKFTHSGGIVIHLWYQEPYLYLQVRDSGVGIDSKDILQLFDPFFQVGSSVQRNFQGTGLGLAICEKLVNMMDGDIAVKSAPDMGSEFTLRLPVWQGEWAAPHQEIKGKRLGLCFKNSAFADYVERIAKALQLETVTSPEQFDSEMLLISDHLPPLAVDLALSAWILFKQNHNDKPQWTEAGYWVMNPATAYQLPELIITLLQGSEQQKDDLALSNAPDRNKQDHSDILILVVDDHPINRLLLSEQLMTLGYQTKTARDGLDALNTLNYHAADIVLSDVNMPNLDGYGLAQQLRQQGTEMPIIGVTANALADEQQRCLDAGMDECLSKPVTLTELSRTLNYFSARVRARRKDNT